MILAVASYLALNLTLKTDQIQKAPIVRASEIQKQIDDKKEAERQAALKAEADKKATEAAQAALVQNQSQTQVSNQSPVKMPVKTISGCGDNTYAQFIYEHESGCNLNARNAGGCLGIGQACPGSKLLNACPDLSYACQNAFFTAYANSAYGGWAGAYAKWQRSHWW